MAAILIHRGTRNHDWSEPDKYAHGTTAVYAEMPGAPAQLIIAGDSIVQWGPWPELLGRNVLNRGVQFEVSSGLVSRTAELKRHQPQTLVVLTGANDLYRKILAQQVVTNVKSVVAAHIAKHVLIVGILPADPSILPPDQVKAVDDALAANAPSWGATYIAPPAGYTAEADTFDGLHPNGAGYKLIAAEILKHLQ